MVVKGMGNEGSWDCGTHASLVSRYMAASAVSAAAAAVVD